MKTFWLKFLLAIGSVFIIYFVYKNTDQKPSRFNSESAIKDVIQQVNFGPRIPGSLAHQQTRELIKKSLESEGWTVEIQTFIAPRSTGYNLFATRGNKQPSILIGAHYDSRLVSDNDPDPQKRSLPVPGADDGASGVAVLLELGRSLPTDQKNVGLVFFDLEDNGNIQDWDWILGSKAFVDKITYTPMAVVVIDMIGEKNGQYYYEVNSNDSLKKQIWSSGKDLGYEKFFIPENKYSIIDDHSPFLEKNIPAVDIIDIEYQYWHTTEDTADKVSATSLKIIGDTLLTWINDYGSCLSFENCETNGKKNP